ncbi:caspase family protein [Candidatus Uabimicrobium amorphum]|uniref:Peptidase C14 caspase domain-containing protein n=1 Tax=Uabimicrobium amorphum TaxID=2596890 RepID=A0A5S9IQN7_UABAM|nr:caspase family protein [Candidatus Uabimicrobium amorphum]BBM86144.1 hypothetical protein UABAM_04530 [Candidatus Uabimicrobium amorphum]
MASRIYLRCIVIFFAFSCFLCAQSENSVLDERLKKIVTQLQSPDARERFSALTDLETMGPTIRVIRPHLEKALKSARGHSRLTINYAIGIINQLKNEPPSQKTTHKTRSIPSLVRKNLGGLNILGVSRDFQQRLNYRKKHALVIGINNYDNFTDLQGPNFDAAAVAGVLDSRFKFENVVLLVDKKPTIAQGNVKWRIAKTNGKSTVTKEAIKECLQKLEREVAPGDALFFYYAGHGIPGYIVVSDSQKNSSTGKPTEKTMISLHQIAKDLDSFKARHTLMVLDSCFSGSLLDNEYRPNFSHLANRSFVAPGGDNLSRVFNRRVFQVITAGTGDEAVADKLDEVSTTYAQKFKDSRGHSPFTAVFIQALQGLVGRADGTILASQLGYHMTDTLVNDQRIGASQAPRYETLGGGGDFMFFPTAQKVLNPKLLSNLYLTNETYQDLRRSACEALEKFILEQKKDFQPPLVQNAIPHFVHLLQKDEPAIKTILKFLAHTAQKYGSHKNTTNFTQVVEPVAKLLRNELQKENKDKELIENTALILGNLYLYATQNAIDQTQNYVKYLAKQWPEEKKKNMLQVFISPQIEEKENEIQKNAREITSTMTKQQQMKYWKNLHDQYYWLYHRGLPLLQKYQEKIKKYELIIQKAEEAYKRSTLHNESNPYYFREREKNYRECGTYAGKALFYIKDLKGLGLLKEKARNLVHLALRQKREIWCSFQHNSDYYSITFSPHDGILAFALDKEIVLYNYFTGTEIRTFRGHSARINFVTFSPDGKTLASASDDKTVKLWDLNGKEITNITGHAKRVNSIAFSPDGRTLVSASNDKTVKLWNTRGKNIANITGHTENVNSVAFSPGGKFIASASDDKTVKLWDIHGKEIVNITGHTENVNSVAFSPDGKFIASASDDKTVKLWDTHGKEIVNITGHTESVNSVAFSPDGKTIASASDNHAPKLWETATGKLIPCITEHASETEFVTILGGSTKNFVAFSPDGKTLAASNNIWNVNTGKKISQVVGHKAPTESLSFSPDGKTLASVSVDNTIIIWEAKTGRQIAKYTLNGFATQVSFNHNGKILIYSEIDSDNEKSTIILQDVEKNRKLQSIAIDGLVRGLIFGSDNKKLIYSLQNGEVRLHDILTNKTTELAKHGKPVTAIALSPNGQILCSASKDDVIIQNIFSGKKLMPPEFFSSTTSIAFSPNGKTLAFSSNDSKIHLWDMESNRKLATFEKSIRPLLSVAFSPDGKSIAASWGDQILIWDIASGKQTLNLTGRTSKFFRIAFSPDGKNLASTSAEGAVRVWDITTPEEIKKITPKTIKKEGDAIFATALSPDGNILAIAKNSFAGLYAHQNRDQIRKWNSAIEIWSIDEKKQISTLKNQGLIGSIYFTPSGTTVNYTSRLLERKSEEEVRLKNTVIKLWNFTTKKLVTGLNHKERGPSPSRAIDMQKRILAISDSWKYDDAGKVELWDLLTGKQISVLEHPKSIDPMAFSPNGQYLACASGQMIYLWNLSLKKRICQLAHQTSGIGKLVFSPNSEYLASFDTPPPSNASMMSVFFSGGTSKEFNLWNIKTGKKIGRLTGHSSGIQSVVFHPDNTKLISFAAKEAILWDTGTAKKIGRLIGHSSEIKSVVFHPNNKAIISSGLDKTVRFWDITTGKQMFQLTLPESIYSVKLHPKEDNIICDSMKNITLWQLNKNTSISRLNANHLLWMKQHKSLSSFKLLSKQQLFDTALTKSPQKFTEILFGFRIDEKLKIVPYQQKYLWNLKKLDPIDYPWSSKPSSMNQKLWNAYLNEDFFAIQRQDLEYLSQFTRKEYVNTVASIYAWLGEKIGGKKHLEISDDDTKMRVKLLQHGFSPKNVESILQEKKFSSQQINNFTNGTLHKKLWRLYLDAQINKIETKDLLLLSYSKKPLEIDTVAKIYACMGNKQRAENFAGNALESTPQSIELLRKELSPLQVENTIRKKVIEVQKVDREQSLLYSFLQAKGLKQQQIDTMNTPQQYLHLLAYYRQMRKAKLYKQVFVKKDSREITTLPISRSTFSSNGKTLIGINDDESCIMQFDIAGNLIKKINIENTNNYFAFSPDHKFVAIADYKNIKLIDIPSGKLVHKWSNKVEITCLAFSRTNKYLAQGDISGRVIIWKMASKRKELIFRQHKKAVLSIAFDPNNDIFSSACDGGIVYTSNTRGQILYKVTHQHPIHEVVFHPKQKKIAFIDKNDQAFFWHYRSRSRTTPTKAIKFPIWNIAFSPDGKTALTSEKNNLRLLTMSRKLIKKSTLNCSEIESIAYSSDQHNFITVANGHTLLWDSITGKQLHARNRLEWRILDFYQNKISKKMLAKDLDKMTPTVRAKFYYYMGLYYVVRSKSSDAKRYFEKCLEQKRNKSVEAILAVSHLKRLEQIEKRNYVRLKQFSPFMVHQLSNGYVGKKLRVLYLKGQKYQINKEELELLSQSSKRRERDTAATIYAWLGDVRKSQNLAKKAFSSTPQKVNLLLMKFSPQQIENLLEGDLHRKLYRIYLTNKKQRLKPIELELLSCSPKILELDTVAKIYAWLGNKKLAYKFANKALLSTSKKVNALLEGTIPTKVENTFSK